MGNNPADASYLGYIWGSILKLSRDRIYTTGGRIRHRETRETWQSMSMRQERHNGNGTRLTMSMSGDVLSHWIVLMYYTPLTPRAMG